MRAVLAGLFLVALAASPALGHAVLVSTEPADGAQLDQSPEAVSVTLSEPVDAGLGAVRVFNSSGERVDSGDAGHGASPEQLAVSVPRLGDGMYIATWRATSSDGHPVRGAFVFTVGEREASLDEGVIAALVSGEGATAGGVAAWMARWAAYLGALVAAGAAAVRLLLTDGSQRRIVDLIRRAAVVGMAASVLQVPLFAVEASGLGVGAAFSPAALTAAATSSVATAAAVRVAALGLLWASAGRARPWLAAAGVGGVVAAELVTGHTRTLEPRWLMVAADGVHVLGAAVWLGGLAALAVVLWSRQRQGELAPGLHLVGRFSALALWSVAVLAVTGAALAYIGVRAPRALPSTAYGLTLIAKTVVVAAVVVVAAYNRRVLVPAVARQAQTGAVSALARLRRTVRLELVGLAVVIGITAVLVNLRPAAEAAGVSGPFSTFVEFGDGRLNLVVDPNRAGTNEIHVYILTPGGFPALAGGQAVAEISLPDRDLGPIERRLEIAGPGHFLHVGPELAIPGEWLVTIRHRPSEFEETVAEVPVTVNP